MVYALGIIIQLVVMAIMVKVFGISVEAGMFGAVIGCIAFTGAYLK